WDVSLLDTDATNEALLHGLTHIAGTAKPGEQGMVAISGHSSNYPWVRSDYTKVFAPLVKANTGQWVSVHYKNVEYTYRITKMYEINPTQVEVLSDHSTTGLRLITCTPIGTSL